MFGEDLRANVFMEGWHRIFQADLEDEHPPIYRWIECVQMYDMKTWIRFKELSEHTVCTMQLVQFIVERFVDSCSKASKTMEERSTSSSIVGSC